MSNFISNRIFNKFDELDPIIQGNTYEDCTFQSCDWGDANLSGDVFADCIFIECSFNANATLLTSFQSVKFERCKIMGLKFSDCSQLLLEMKFSDSKVEYCGFQNLKTQNLDFNACSLLDADFYNANIKGVRIIECDLSGAIFDNTILENADLRQSYNFQIDSEINYIQGVRFTMSSFPGWLVKYKIKIDE